jgi:hypothetical protein
MIGPEKIANHEDRPAFRISSDFPGLVFRANFRPGKTYLYRDLVRLL